jgi:hypothetical protein
VSGRMAPQNRSRRESGSISDQQVTYCKLPHRDPRHRLRTTARHRRRARTARRPPLGASGDGAWTRQGASVRLGHEVARSFGCSPISARRGGARSPGRPRERGSGTGHWPTCCGNSPNTFGYEPAPCRAAPARHQPEPPAIGSIHVVEDQERPGPRLNGARGPRALNVGLPAGQRRSPMPFCVAARPQPPLSPKAQPRSYG